MYPAILSLARSLVEGGTSVTVYGVHDEAFDPETWRGIKVKVFTAWPPRRFAIVPALGSALRSGRHDIVHQHGLWLYPSIAVDHCRKVTGRATVISPHGMLEPWAIGHAALKKRLARALFEDSNLRGARALHALNAAEAQALRSLGIDAPIAIIPNSVEIRLPANLPRPPFMSDERNVLLFLGRLHRKKGLDALIDAWARTVGGRPEVGRRWQLVVAGWDDGGYRPILERLVTEAGLSSHVTLTGPLYGDEKLAALAHARAFILPSRSEGSPMAVLEAWSWGLPVFITHACNFPEAFAVGAAIEIEAEGAALAATLKQMLNVDQLATLRQIGAQGQAWASKRFSAQNNAQSMIDLYRWVAGYAPRPEGILLEA
jgi:poly(glycerol-phosphate) alpha-glucosyltransferase